MLHAVLKHPRITGGMGYDVVHQIERNTRLRRQRHRLCPGGNMHPGEQLVDNFHRRALTNLCATAINLARGSIQHRLQAGKRLITAGSHHRHLTSSRFRRPTGYRRVQHDETTCGKCFAKTFGILCCNRRRHHHRRAGFQLVGERTVAKQHRFHLLGIDHQQHHRVQLAGKTFGRRRDRFRARCLQSGKRLRIQIHAIRLKPGAYARLRHAHPHRAQADDCYCIRHDEPLVMCEKRERY